MKKNKELLLIGIVSIITIILNVLMIYVVKGPNQNQSIFSNAFIIAVIIGVFIKIKNAYDMGNEKMVRIERFGIIALCTYSLMWFVNRIDQFPDRVNGLGFIIAIGMGTFFLSVAFGRQLKMKKSNKR